MRKTALILSLLLLMASWGQAQLFPKLGAQRAGISALTFLKIDVSPRSAAMGGANLNLTGDVYATWWNPAALSDLEHLTFGVSNTFWVAGINHAYFSAVRPDSKIGTIALSVTSLTTGKMERRTEFQPYGTGEYFSASNTAVGLSYARNLTDMFSFGLTIKYVNESLAEFKAHTAVLDLGFVYRTDFKDLKFAVMLQSFGINSKLKGTFSPDDLSVKPTSLESYPAPTMFKLGISIVPLKLEKHSITTAVQLNHPNDNAENIRFGVEYEYRKLLFMRVGYQINVKDQNYPTFGVGVQTSLGKHPLSVDYSANPTKYLGWFHRVGISFGINTQKRKEMIDSQEVTQ